MSTTTLTASEFIDRLEQDRNLFIVDLRTHAEVASECLDNCLHLPVQDLSNDELSKRMQAKGVSPDTPIYLLCQSGKRASMAVDKLSGDKDLSLVILDGGLNAIKQAGGKVQSSDRKVMSLERQVRIVAGVLIMLGVVLGYSVHSGFFLMSGFVGAGLTFAGITDTCGMGMMLARMPWNTRS